MENHFNSKWKMRTFALRTTAALSLVFAANTALAQALSQTSLDDGFKTAPNDRLMKALERLEQGGKLVNDGYGIDYTTTSNVGDVAKFHDVTNNKLRTYLPMQVSGSRLDGEIDHLEWQAYVTRRDIERGVKLYLAYKNAVSVMPEASRLNVEVNGRSVFTTPIHSPDRTRRLAIDLPAGTLRPGKNLIRVTANQRHRVDCSVPATYELWTDIVTSKSGLEFKAGADRIQSIEDLAGLPLSADQRMSMRLLMGAKPTLNQIQMYARLVQYISLRTNIDTPNVSIAEAASLIGGAGLNLFVGNRSELIKRFPQYAETSLIDGKINIIPAKSGDQALVAAIVSDSVRLAELTQLPNFSREKQDGKKAKSDRRFQLHSNYQADEKQDLYFDELGYQEIEFGGRRFNADFKLNLPADFYPGDYNNIDLHLYGGYAPGMKRDARLIIRVNGVTQVSMSVGNPKGDIFENRKLKIPLSAFQPGTNNVEIEAHLHNQADETCSVANEEEDEGRFFLSNKSYFTIPTVAHLGQWPNLSNTLMTGFPYSGENTGSNALGVYLGDREPSSLSSAIALINHMAIKSGRYVNADYLNGAPEGNKLDRHAIIVGEYRNLPSKLAARMPGIDVRQYARDWSNPVSNYAVAQNPGYNGIDANPTASYQSNPGATDRPASRINILDDLPKSNLLAKWKNKDEEKEYKIPKNNMLSFVGKILDPIITMGTGANVKDDPIDTSTSLLASQFQENGYAVTVITAPDGYSMKQGVNGLLQPSSYVASNAATFGYYANEKSVARSANDIAKEGKISSWSFNNLRLLVAGWLSKHPSIFAAVVLLIVGFIGMTAGWTLRTVGRPHDGGLSDDTRAA